MSDILENLAAAERFLAQYASRVAYAVALDEDAKWRETMTMAQQEELLAEAMTNAKHVCIEDLSEAQQRVALLRLEIGDKWTQPDVMDSYVFLVSEIGEVGDALLRANFGHRRDYSRNNTKYADVAAELGDVFLMLCTLATTLGIDLDSALQGCVDKLRSKHDTT